MSRVRDFIPPGDFSALAFVPYDLVSLLALGMALSFIIADRASLTSRYLALTFVFIGLSIDLNIVIGIQFNVRAALHGCFSLGEGLASIALLEWIMRVRRTVPAGDLDVRAGDRVLRAGQIAAAAYCLLAVLYPEIRLRDFLGALNHEQPFMRPGFWLFAAPMFFSGFAGTASILLLLNRHPDPPEKARVAAMALAIPFFMSSFVLPLFYNALPLMLGEIVFLLGATQYHVLQGERAEFMSRFLSPQVARLVAERGLASAMREQVVELTVVCCDLRGFTAYAEATPSERVLAVLREYYDDVGDVVAEFGATIKDFAGDGILMLVGAPIATPYHAQRGLEMAQRIRAVGIELTRRWSTTTHTLGIGLGVSSGMATVGVIGSAVRLEYTAVGSTVNLACRLCEQAAHAEILVDQRTRDLIGAGAATARMQAREPVEVKGFSRKVENYAVPA